MVCVSSTGIVQSIILCSQEAGGRGCACHGLPFGIVLASHLELSEEALSPGELWEDLVGGRFLQKSPAVGGVQENPPRGL